MNVHTNALQPHHPTSLIARLILNFLTSDVHKLQIQQAAPHQGITKQST